jgi:tRNA(Ile)-lysidine synthase
MRRAFDVYRRPLLDVSRTDTETACVAEGLTFWTDPHNEDEVYTRVRVRTRVLPVLEEELGPGVTAALARTADLLRADTVYLDAVTDAALAQVRTAEGLAVETLGTLDVAIRSRVLRQAALDAGAPSAELFHGHVTELDRLVTDWHGQKWVDLPGHLRALRSDGRIRFTRVTAPTD